MGDAAADAPGGARLVLAAAALAFGPAAALGIARFGYALLLPSMRTSLGWSYVAAGTLNTANAAGYLAGAVVASAAGRRFGVRRTLVWSVSAVVASVFLCAASTSLVVLSLLRIVAGVAGGAVYVVGGGLAASLGGTSARRASLALGIYFGGVGAGILLSGLVVPQALGSGSAHWRLGWVLLGAGTLAGLAVVSGALWRLQLLAPSRAVAQAPVGKAALRHLRPTVVAYFLEGVGYIAYMTFVIALIRGRGASTATTVLFWSVLGAGAMLAAPLLTPALAAHRFRGGRGLALGIAAVAAAAILPVLSVNVVVLLVSGALFGGSFITVSALVAVIAREALPAELVTAALGRLTVVFGLGQVLGPVLAGSISDTHAGLRLGLAASALVLALAVPVALLQRPEERRSLSGSARG